ncbi:MAG: entericidin A/B family lipoprotein [Proteobacteria bacterium]|nr:entericidin A/B family lipoprotein [Pseudomonadota bacterium]
MKVTYKTANVMIVVAIPLFLFGCNTMEGAGTDIKEAGKALERSADKNKPSSSPCHSCPRSPSSRPN